MKKIVFWGNKGDIEIGDNITWLKDIIFDPSYSYWIAGSGGGAVVITDDNEPVSTLIIEPNPQYGFYLHYFDDLTDAQTMSLYDESLLHEVISALDDIYASKGLFLPPELAWEGISTYVKNGELSDRIRWITPEMIPEDGNY